MLQNIRKGVHGTTAKILVGLIVISFSIFGIESILLGGGGNEIAEVNGDPIYPEELDRAVEDQQRRLIAMMGDNFDPALLDDQRLRPLTLEALIGRKLLMQFANKLNLVISKPEIGTVIGSMEEFKSDGVFSPGLFKSVLANVGYTPASFKRGLADDILSNQLRSGIIGSEFATPAELELSTQVTGEQRAIRYFTVPRDKYAATTRVSEEQIQAYYEANQDAFRTPESVDVDYIELNQDDFRQPVAESAILEAFELAKHESQAHPQDRVSHILFESGVEGDDNERLALARKELANGVPFAEVAEKYSDDPGSAGNGGDLGYTGGNTFPAAMEEAIAQLEPGVVSEPIKTEAGTHLVVVTERLAGQEPDLESMRAQLEENIQVQEARVALLRAVESLRDISFNAEDLTVPAKELGLIVKQAEGVTRMSQNAGLLSHPALMEAAFSEDVMLAGHNSDVIEISADSFVVLRVRRHNDPEVMPLTAVREQITAAITGELERSAVVAEANLALGQSRNGVVFEEIATKGGYIPQTEPGIARNSSVLAPEVLARVFDLPQPDENAATTDYVIADNGDVVVFELLDVNPGNYKALPESEQMQLKMALTSEFGSLVDNELQRGLRDSASITVR